MNENAISLLLCVCVIYIRLKTTKYCIVTSNWSERVKIVSISFILACFLVKFPWFLDNSSIALVRNFHGDSLWCVFNEILLYCLCFFPFLVDTSIAIATALVYLYFYYFIYFCHRQYCATHRWECGFFYTHRTTIQFMT